MSEVNGSTLVARGLAQQEIDTVFTVVGGPVIEAVGACGAAGVRPIGVRHEQAAAFSAAAYGYVANSISACLLASGPAVTNAVTGAHVAYDNSLPLLILGGSSALATAGYGGFQESDSISMMRPVTKWQAQATSPGRIPELIAYGVREAKSGRPGPVYIDLPGDILNATVEEENVRPVRKVEPPARPPGDPAAIERAAEALRKAERPLVLIGKGVRWSSTPEQLTALVEALDAPFLASPMGRGFIPDDHRLNVAAARSTAMRNADAILILGARLNWMFGFGRAFAEGATVIQVDIDGAELGRTRPIDIGIVGDVGAVLDRLNAALVSDGATPRESPWLDDLRAAIAANEEAVRPLVDSDEVPMTHHRLMREIRDVIPRETIITVDGQISFSTARQMLPTFTPAARLNSGSNGCMGVGVPFAVGAALARPGTPVLSLNGDAAFGFNGLEVETAVRYRLPIVFVIDNNDGIMGAVLEGQMFEGGHPEPVAMYQPGARYDRVMEAFGGHAEHVEDPADLRAALERSLANAPALINVRVDPNAIWPIPRAGRGANALMGY